jgi:hypothetical protein
MATDSHRLANTLLAVVEVHAETLNLLMYLERFAALMLGLAAVGDSSLEMSMVPAVAQYSLVVYPAKAIAVGLEGFDPVGTHVDRQVPVGVVVFPAH